MSETVDPLEVVDPRGPLPYWLNFTLAISACYAVYLFVWRIAVYTNPPQPSRMRTVYGEWCLVTGASSGIGREVVKFLVHRAHMKVIAVARRGDRLGDLQEEADAKIEAYTHMVEQRKDVILPTGDKWDDPSPGSLFTVTADITTPQGRQVIERAVSEHVPQGALGILVNAAGSTHYNVFADTAPEKLQALLNLNAVSHMNVTRTFLPAMIEKKKGAVVFVGGFASHAPAPFGALVAACQAFLRTLAHSLRAEVHLMHKCPEMDIMVVEPSSVDTDLSVKAGLPRGFMRKFNKRIMPARDAAEAMMKPLVEKAALVIDSAPATVVLGCPVCSGNWPSMAARVFSTDWVAKRVYQRTRAMLVDAGVIKQVPVKPAEKPKDE